MCLLMKEYYQDCKVFEMGGTKYYLLLMRCPHCLARNYPTVTERWQHAGCGGDIFIGDNAKLLCKDCGWSMHVSKTKFNCTNHCNCEDDTVETSDKGDLFDPGSIRPSILHRAGALWCVSLLSNMKN